MTHADEIQKAPVPVSFPIAIVKTAQIPLQSEVVAAERLRSGRLGELNLSGSQVLVGCVSALCTVGLLLWTLIKFWLFEP